MNKNFVVVAVLPSELDEAQSHTLGKLLRGVSCRMESFVIAPSGDLGGCIDELIQKTLHLMEREGRPVLLLHPPLGDVGGWLNAGNASDWGKLVRHIERLQIPEAAIKIEMVMGHKEEKKVRLLEEGETLLDMIARASLVR